MFRLKKTLKLFLVFCFALFFFLSVLPALRTPLLDTSRQPLIILTFLKREIGAIIFYHRNFTRNEKLSREVDFLRQQLNTLREAYLENLRLKQMFSFKQSQPHRFVAARVIGRSADNWSSTVILDKGELSGIKRGMPAVTYLGLLGRVSETARSTSKLMLITDPNFSVSAIVQRSRQEGLVSGALGPHLIMKYLPEGADIKVSDIIVTSGLNETYPKGLIIGTVEEVGREFSGLSRYAVIKPAVNLSAVEETLIMLQ